MKKSQVKNEFDTVASEYDFVVTLTENKDSLLLDNLPKSLNKALDIGCGSGNNTLLLANYFNEVIGIDISESFLKIANEKKKKSQTNNIKFIKMNAEDINLKDTFDMIYSRTTFHHLDIKQVVEECISILNPGGVLYIKDNVSKNPTPPTYVYIIGALLEFLPNYKKYGFINARRIFNHSVSKEWLSHLATDKYLSEEQYKDTYSKLLPGCQFVKEGWAMNVIWVKSK